ncbi:MAG: hypothetical protein ABI647_19810 [Gemmatimonadota bacterium]
MLAQTDPGQLGEAGWGVLFAPDTPPEVREALMPLLGLRRMQSDSRYREFAPGEGYRPRDTATHFLSRQGIGPGRSDPAVVPYYLLIVGSPEQIPYRFQQQLDVQYAVGRIHFDQPAMYNDYAQSVVASETRSIPQSRSIAIFSPKHDSDLHSTLTTEGFVRPVANDLLERGGGWSVTQALGTSATKERLAGLLNGTAPPALLFAAAHAAVFREQDPRFLARQGALICQDWPGPGLAIPVMSEMLFGAEDVIGTQFGLLGMVAMLWASFSAGVGTSVGPSASRPTLPMVARLPQQLLAAGSLAVLGFADRIRGFSFATEKPVEVYRAAMVRAVGSILAGDRVGYATQRFGASYAELAGELNGMLESIRAGLDCDRSELSRLWTATSDMRNLTLLGDPAVRLPAAVASGPQTT